MKKRDKNYLKALLLASMSSIGLTASHAAGSSGIIVRKEREGSYTSTEMVSETLTNGVLESHPSFGEVLGHTSHSSHGSHGSHTSSSHMSHSSHISSSHMSHASSSSGGSGNSTKIAATALGGLAGTVGLTYLVNYIIKTHSKHVALRKAEINRNRVYASRDLKGGMYGNDVDQMTDLLIENEVLEPWDRKFSHKWLHIKYNRKVRRSVKQMQTRMGRQKTGKASSAFLMSLQEWKDSRDRLIIAVSRDSLNLMEDHNALLAVAILLVEKGYLNSYDADDIMSEHEKSKIIKAYNTFLHRNQLPKTTLVDEQRLRLLNSLPDKQE